MKELNIINSGKKNYRNPVSGRFTTNRRRIERLYLAIKLKGFQTISEFASKTKFSREFISSIIYYHISPTIDQAQEICKILGVSISDIFYPTEIRDWDVFLKASEIKNEESSNE